MNKVAGMCLLVGLLAFSAQAGTVAFDPPVVTVAQGETAEYLVTITSTDLADFDSISLLFSSYTEGLDVSFEHDPSLVTSLDPPEPAPALAFPTDLFAGGNNFGLWQAPAVVGTLRISTTGLAPGTYDDIIALRPEEEAAIFSEPLSAVALGATGEVEALYGTAGLVVTGSDTGTGGDDGGSTETPTDDPADTAEPDGADGEPDTPADDPDVPAGTGDDDGADPVDPQDPTGDDGDDPVGDGTGDAGDAIGTEDDALPDSDDGAGDVEVVTGDAAEDEDDPSVGPRVGGGFCGLGILGGCMFMLLGLATLRFCRFVRLL